ncbi:MAG: inorganic phosphate transporter [Bacteroidia bacterium]|jgi:PiT family inorganic phosphate transporter|nr:inorganic phosphate transporter [Bacteroidia bacterium]
MFGLDPTLTALLLFCLFAAFAFEFINGFHDTANAVATVIYTNSLKPWVAVVWSGIWNAIGVFAGGIAVAVGITSLLPVEVLTDTNIHHNVALIMALLITAIIWNLGTWYLGIPCSSSHTLIGSILGVGLAFSLIAENQNTSYVNWGKAGDIGLSLLVSPFVGFSLAILLMYVLRQTVKNKSIFKEPNTTAPPPFWIRSILLVTCTAVSFSHGSNDGQKGVGLVMLILIAIVPGYFALNGTINMTDYKSNLADIKEMVSKVDRSQMNKSDSFELVKFSSLINDLDNSIAYATEFEYLTENEKFVIRKDVILIAKSAKKLLLSADLNLSQNDKGRFKSKVEGLKEVTDYAPTWVIVMIALALGFGTMIGWKRIVKTIGEKIGKQHLTYAQGASSELVAASTIGLSTYFGLPVSTTQVLSSGIAGSMVASKGVKNLQPATIKSIAIAWVLTLPVTILLSGGLFLLFRLIL